MGKPEKPFNGGQWTNARMMSFIRSALRGASIRWNPMQQAKKDARRAYHGLNARRKWEYLCGVCGGWFAGNETRVHHIEPCGELNKFEDIGMFCKRLFCEKEGFIVMCDGCHIKEHKGDK